MAFLQWKEEYSVGIDHIDEQHRGMIQLIDDLAEAVFAGQGRLVLEDILESLLAYTRSHFKDEEAMMERAAYPGLEQHRELHRELTAQVRDLQDRYENGEESISTEVLYFLRDWLTNHILSEDQGYREYVLRDSEGEAGAGEATAG
jgi:hemerythrin